MPVDFNRPSAQGVSGFVKVEPSQESPLPPPPSRPLRVPTPPPLADPSRQASTRSAWPSVSSSSDPTSPFSRNLPPHLQPPPSTVVQASAPRPLSHSPPPLPPPRPRSPSPAALPFWSDPWKMSEEAMNAWGAPEVAPAGGLVGFESSRREEELVVPRTEVDIALERLGKGKQREKIVVEEEVSLGPGYSLLSRLGVLPSEVLARGGEVVEEGADRRSRTSSSQSGSLGGVGPLALSSFGSRTQLHHQPLPPTPLPRSSTPQTNLPTGSETLHSFPPTTHKYDYTPLTPPGAPPSSAYEHSGRRSNYPPAPLVATAFGDLRSRQELERNRLAEDAKELEAAEEKLRMEESRQKKEREEEEERVKEELGKKAVAERMENEQARTRLWEQRNEGKKEEKKQAEEKARLKRPAVVPAVPAPTGPSRRTRSPPAGSSTSTLVRGHGSHQRSPPPPPPPSKLQPSTSSLSSRMASMPRNRSPLLPPRSRSPLPPPPSSLHDRLRSNSPPPRRPLPSSRSPYRRPPSPPPRRRSPSPRYVGRYPPNRSRSPPPRFAQRSRSPPGPPIRGVYSKSNQYAPPPPASLRYRTETSPSPRRRRPSWSSEDERREDQRREVDEDRWRDDVRRRRTEDERSGVADAGPSDLSRAPALSQQRSRSPPRVLSSSRPPLASSSRLAVPPSPPLPRHQSTSSTFVSPILARLEHPPNQASPGVYERVRSQPVASSSRRSLSPPRRSAQDLLPPPRRSRSPELVSRDPESRRSLAESRYGSRAEVGAGGSKWRDDGRRAYQNGSRSPPRGPLSIPRVQKEVPPPPRRPQSPEPGRYERRPSPSRVRREPSPPPREVLKPTTRPPWPNSITHRSPTPEALLRQQIPTQHVVVTSSPQSPRSPPPPPQRPSSPPGTPPYPPPNRLVDESPPVKAPPPLPPTQSLTDRFGVGVTSAAKTRVLPASSNASTGPLLDRLNAAPSTTPYQPRPPPPPTPAPRLVPIKPGEDQVYFPPPSNRPPARPPIQPRPPVIVRPPPPPPPPPAARPGLLDRMQGEIPPPPPSILDRFAAAATPSLSVRPTNPPPQGPTFSHAQRESVRPKPPGNLAARLSSGSENQGVASPSASSSSSLGTPPGSPRLLPQHQHQQHGSGLLARLNSGGGGGGPVSLANQGGGRRSGTPDQPLPRPSNASTSSSASSFKPTPTPVPTVSSTAPTSGPGGWSTGQKKVNPRIVTAKRGREVAEASSSPASEGNEGSGSGKRQRTSGSVGGGGGGEEEEGEVDRFL